MTSKSVSSGQIFPMNPSLCFAPCYILRSVTQYRCSININWINEWMFCFIFQGSCRNQVKSGDKSNLPWNCHYIIHPAFLPYSKMIKAVGYERIWVCVCGGVLTQWLSGKESACSAGDAEMWVGSLGQEDPLEEEMVTHSSILAWRIHGQRSLVGNSPWGHKRVRHNWATKQQDERIFIIFSSFLSRFSKMVCLPKFNVLFHSSDSENQGKRYNESVFKCKNKCYNVYSDKSIVSLMHEAHKFDRLSNSNLNDRSLQN